MQEMEKNIKMIYYKNVYNYCMNVMMRQAVSHFLIVFPMVL